MKNRGQTINCGDIVQLKELFQDHTGNPVDLNAFPEIQVKDSSNTIYLPYTSLGVYRISTGIYAYNLQIPLNGAQGTWVDEWRGTVGAGLIVNANSAFTVLNYNVPNAMIEDGYEQLGDLPLEELSQNAIHNINILMQILRRRLQSSGIHFTKDSLGNPIYENCDIFSIEEMKAFLCSSLSDFNTTPHVTDFHWEDDIVIQYRDVIVEGAYIIALGSKALIEKGREFTISDNGISYTPPQVADLLNSQMSTLIGAYREKLKQIKYSNFKYAFSAGLGTLRITQVAPQFLRLRHRREIQFL